MYFTNHFLVDVSSLTLQKTEEVVFISNEDIKIMLNCTYQRNGTEEVIPDEKNQMEGKGKKYIQRCSDIFTSWRL